jgi:hypothetical protein
MLYYLNLTLALELSYIVTLLAEAEVQDALTRNRLSMEDRKVSTKIHGELKKVKGIVTTTDEFYDRFYLIHGIWACVKDHNYGRRVSSL